MNAKQTSQYSRTQCFNCGSFERISPFCNKPKQPNNICFTCGFIDHQINSCLQNQLYTSVQCQDSSSSSTIVIQPSDVVTPVYVININLIFFNNLFSNIPDVVNTDSLVSLLRK